MADNEYIHYHDEKFDTRCHSETYTGAERPFKEDAMEVIMKHAYKVLSSGCVKGDTIIDVSLGLYMFQLFVAADYFKNIILIESSDCSVDEIQKWIKKEPGAVDKSHMAMYACALKGKSTGWKDQEDKLRNAIKQVVKWDISQENPLGSVVLPQADCLISVVYLDGVCKDHNMFLKGLKHFSSLLKTGGHLILYSCINMTYYMTGQHKLSSLKYDEEFLRKALANAGLLIKSLDKLERKFETSLTDYEYIGCIVCSKESDI